MIEQPTKILPFLTRCLTAIKNGLSSPSIEQV